MKRYAFDIETNGLEDASIVHCIWIEDLDTSERWDYADQPGHLPITEGLDKLLEADLLVGHNILTYDVPTLKKIYPTWNPKALIRDTLVITRLIWPEVKELDIGRMKRGKEMPPALIGKHSLKSWGYRLDVLKADFGKTEAGEDGDSTIWATWTPEMHAYCGQDVTVSVMLWRLIETKNYAESSIQLEHDFRWVIHLQETFGFGFNTAKAASLHVELTRRQVALTKELQEIFPPREEVMKTPSGYSITFDDYTATGLTKKEVVTKAKRDLCVVPLKALNEMIVPLPMKVKLHAFNPGSRQQISQRLIERHGWVPTSFTDTGQPKVDETILEALPWPEASKLNDYLIVEKRLGTLAEGDNALLKLEKKGRIHGRVITNGTVTGRCAHFKPNVAQTPSVRAGKEGPIRGLKGGYGWEFRELYEADPGYVLVGADASGLELRMLAHFMAKYDGGAYGRVLLEGDIHTVNQQAAGLTTRMQAKTFIYAYLYGAGDAKLGTIYYDGSAIPPADLDSLKSSHGAAWAQAEKRIRKDNRIVTDQEVGCMIRGSILRESFESKTPALALLKAAIFIVVTAPGSAWVNKQIRDRQQMLEDAGFDVPEFKGYLVGLDGRRLHIRSAHSALNTLLQSAGALVVKMATVLFYKAACAKGWVFGKDYALVAHVHDELQSQAKKSIGTELGQMVVDAIRDAGVLFKFRLQLAGEFKIGRNWAETH